MWWADVRPVLLAFVAGILFGLGLTISRMIDPAKVLGFLDVTGNWDPSLALVMAGALAVKTGRSVLLVVAHPDEADDAVEDLALFGSWGQPLNTLDMTFSFAS